jgi:hypothetical protein
VKRRRRNPVNNKTLMYVGAGIAVLGVGYILYQSSQANAGAASAPTLPATSPSGSVASTAIAAGSAYAQCIAAGGNALTCLGQSQS